MSRTIARLALTAGLLGMASAPASADALADAFKGKTVTIVVGTQAGTGFDVYSRVLIRHMGRHIPGNPDMIVQNMPGASGIQSANWLYAVAPKDGTAIGTFPQSVPFERLYGNTSAKYDPMQFNWIGHLDESVAVCGIRSDAGVGHFSELKEKEVIIGATGATGPLVKSASAVANMFGAKFKIVTGYKGSASVKTAMQAGEVQGICGLPWSTITSFWADMLQDGSYKPILQLSGAKTEALKGVAHARDLADTPELRQLYNLVFGVFEIGRMYALPPGVAADRVAAMRKAFMDTTKDPQFIADAAKTRIDLSPRGGEELANILKEILSTPADIVEKAKQAQMQPK